MYSCMSIFVFFSLHCVEALQTEKKAFHFWLSIVSFLKHKVSKKSCHQSVSVYTSSLLHFPLLFGIFMTFFKFPRRQRNDIYDESHYKLSLPSFETNKQTKKNSSIAHKTRECCHQSVTHYVQVFTCQPETSAYQTGIKSS